MYISSLYNDLIEGGEEFRAHFNTEPWADIDYEEDLEKAKEIFPELKK